jgi:hypothetical protein
MGTNSVSLDGANIESVGVDIRKKQKTICPRQRVQMAVFMKAKLKGENKFTDLETWQGKTDANKNGKLEFNEFAFHSEQGTFDDHGWFSPSTNLLTTVSTEFQLKTVYKRRPDKFSLDTTYKPDYECIKGGGQSGRPGTSGSYGAPGQSGQSGSNGSQGTDGNSGGSGGEGGDGGDGPQIQAYLSYVKTPFYDKLIAIRLDGDVKDFLLIMPEAKFILTAQGGHGGNGGPGGRGGGGGNGGSGNPPGRGGNGGAGGPGGKGGKGGKGGHVEVFFPEKYPELAKALLVNVAGGTGGLPGLAGTGGRGGAGGTGVRGESTGSGGSSLRTTPPPGERGKDGLAGNNGPGGAAGPEGTVHTQTADITSYFSEYSGVQIQ